MLILCAKYLGGNLSETEVCLNVLGCRYNQWSCVSIRLLLGNFNFTCRVPLSVCGHDVTAKSFIWPSVAAFLWRCPGIHMLQTVRLKVTG